MKLYSRTRSYIIEGTIDNWRKIGTQVLQLCEGRNFLFVKTQILDVPNVEKGNESEREEGTKSRSVW